MQRFIFVLAPLLLLTVLSAMASYSGADWTFLLDEFHGRNGEEIEQDDWIFQKASFNDEATIDGNALKLSTQGTEYATCMNKDHIPSTNFVAQVDFKTTDLKGVPFVLLIETNDASLEPYEVRYIHDVDHGWEVHYSQPGGGGTITHTTFVLRITKNWWYTVTVSALGDKIDVKVVDKANSVTILNERFTYEWFPEFGNLNAVGFGCTGTTTYFDNFRLIGKDLPVPNLVPRWAPVPIIDAVEDVNITVDFSPILVNWDLR